MDTLRIVPVADIPTAQDTPTDNLIELYKTCLLMEQVCLTNHGIGLSAVQVGIPWKLFIVRTDRTSFEYFVNCEYEPEGDEKVKGVEGCLSIRDSDGELRMYQVERWKKVRVKGQRLTVSGKPALVPVDWIEDDELYTIVYQHEIDHHRNVLISDIGREVELRR